MVALTRMIAGDERQKRQLTPVAATQEVVVELCKRKMHELKEALASQDCELISPDPVGGPPARAGFARPARPHGTTSLR